MLKVKEKWKEGGAEKKQGYAIQAPPHYDRHWGGDFCG